MGREVGVERTRGAARSGRARRSGSARPGAYAKPPWREARAPAAGAQTPMRTDRGCACRPIADAPARPMLGSGRSRRSTAGRRARRGPHAHAAGARGSLSAAPRGRATASPPDRHRPAPGGLQRDGPADRHEPADAVPPAGHPEADAGSLRARRLSGRRRRSLRREGAAGRGPRGLHGRAQADPRDGRDDRRLRALPARRRLPVQDRVAGLRDQRQRLAHAPHRAESRRRTGHRERGQRDRPVQARALGPRHRGQPGPQRRLQPDTAPSTSA